jgi:formylglycine-generating enzyme required for sulfatase activity
MPQCPVCQTRFVEGNGQPCPQCGWDTQSLSLVIGLIPEVVEKEATRLQWAKNLWRTAQEHQAQLHQTQAQLNQVKADYQAILAELPSMVEPVPPDLPLLSPPQDSTPLETEPESELILVDRSPAPVPLDSSTRLEPKAESEPELIFADLPPAAALESPSPPVLEPQRAAASTLSDRVSLQDWRVVSSAPVLPFVETPVRSHPQSTEPQPFDFEMATLSAQGVQRQKQTALGFSQPLGEGVTLKLVVLPGGEFFMGSPKTEAERDRNEEPQHWVTVPPFCISQFPITQAQWQRVASFPKIKRSLSLYPADFEGADRPVEQVSWYDCIEFCARLSDYTGQPYRLPSEAEWEYACRAGTTTPFHFGETLLSDLANYDGNYTCGKGEPGIYRHQTTVIGTFTGANAFGLLDMHGNVWEWCLDSWHETYHEAPQDGSAWEDQEPCYRVLRGGAWYCLPGLCRSAQRHWNQPDVGGMGIGFRIVCPVD